MSAHMAAAFVALFGVWAALVVLVLRREPIFARREGKHAVTNAPGQFRGPWKMVDYSGNRVVTVWPNGQQRGRHRAELVDQVDAGGVGTNGRPADYESAASA